MPSATQPKPRLRRQDWVDAALRQLSGGGVAAVTIEELASQLGVTRGSFYHHFGDREELLRAMLDYWAQRWTYEIRDRLGALGLDPGATLLALMRTVRSEGVEFDAPFRAWALHDPLARAVVEQVDQVRLDFIRSQFEGLGFSGRDSENRARLCLYYEVASPAIFARLSANESEELLLERHRLLTTAQSD